MSLVDTTFGSIPAPLLRKWGQTVTFHKAANAGTYNPTTGAITTTTTTYTAKALVTRIQSTELTGVLQSTDYKVIVAPSEIGGNIITTSDSFTFTRASRSIKGKVVEVTAIEGDTPIMFIAFVRPQ